MEDSNFYLITAVCLFVVEEYLFLLVAVVIVVGLLLMPGLVTSHKHAGVSEV